MFVTRKINQNMEFGDIIYFILLVFFMILGFFNDSRKKKKQQQQLEEETAPYSGPGEGTPPRPSAPPVKVPRKKEKKEERPVFQSSLEQVTDYKKYDSGEEIEFNYDTDSVDDFEEGIPMLHESMLGKSTLRETPAAPGGRRASDSQRRGTPHPYLTDLYKDESIDALKKGLIYSEILQRKY